MKDKKAIEAVQKFALKVVTSRWDGGYEELMQLVDLQPLEDGRVEMKLGLLFKIIHNLCFFPDGSLNYRNCWSGSTGVRTRGAGGGGGGNCPPPPVIRLGGQSPSDF